EQCESIVTKVFSLANLLAIYCKRVTVIAKDLECLRRLLKEWNIWPDNYVVALYSSGLVNPSTIYKPRSKTKKTKSKLTLKKPTAKKRKKTPASLSEDESSDDPDNPSAQTGTQTGTSS
ncbi:uncharacterized protein SEPMUDRAFT_55259, partial [Sphaerulina musiva SO2202]